MIDQINYLLCGIDEAGRGPIAGPLVVAGVKFKKTIINNTEITKMIKDSKTITHEKREKLFDYIKLNSYYSIVYSSNEDIDCFGLTIFLKKSIITIMNNIKSIDYLIDGNTAFGIENIKYKIKADENVLCVSAASILAKVSRDRYMLKISSLYPEYNLEINKGYGTKKHLEQISKLGRSFIHRKSFKIKKLDK